jgi:hypothetical protein
MADNDGDVEKYHHNLAEHAIVDYNDTATSCF